MNLATGWVWVVIRLDEEGHRQLQGVTDDETKAIEMCEDENYMIGPIPINTTLPKHHMEWAGSYFPCAVE